MNKTLNRKEIETILPHTGFMLLPETFTSFEKEGELYGEGTMKIKEYSLLKTLLGIFFPKFMDNGMFIRHHFDCIPGVILIEFAAQVAALLAKTNREIDGLPIALRFKDPAPEFGRHQTVTGDSLIASVKLTKDRRGMFFFEATVKKQVNIEVLTTGIVGAAAQKQVF